jgi:hypothetical protein
MRMCEFTGGQVDDFSTQVKSKLKPVLIKFSFIREKSRYMKQTNVTQIIDL